MAHAAEAAARVAEGARPESALETLGSMFQHVLGGDTGDPAVDYTILLLRAVLILVGISLALQFTYYIVSLAVQVRNSFRDEMVLVHPPGFAYGSGGAIAPEPDVIYHMGPPLTEDGNDLPHGVDLDDDDDDGYSPMVFDDEEEDDEEEEGAEEANAPPVPAAPPASIVVHCTVLDKTRNQYRPPEGTELAFRNPDLDGYGLILEITQMYDTALKAEIVPPAGERRCHVGVSREFWDSIPEPGCKVVGRKDRATRTIFHLQKYVTPDGSSEDEPALSEAEAEAEAEAPDEAEALDKAAAE